MTRHIPIHVVSVDDHADAALHLGAIGYALKPVAREDARRGASASSKRKFGARSRDACCWSRTIARCARASTQLLARRRRDHRRRRPRAEALDELPRRTFDCMVMDLTLPDASGYELLERMATREHASFPPVIVYTGRALSPDEEQRLRRYSQLDHHQGRALAGAPAR